MYSRTHHRSWIPRLPRRAFAPPALALTLLLAPLAPVSAQTPSYTTFSASGAGKAANQGTLASSINTGGTIAGVYADSSNVYHGFVRATTGTITGFETAHAGKGSK